MSMSQNYIVYSELAIDAYGLNLCGQTDLLLESDFFQSQTGQYFDPQELTDYLADIINLSAISSKLKPYLMQISNNVR